MVTRIACFVTAHGYGHAARTCALIEQIALLRPDLRVDVYSAVPEWFFAESLSVPWTLHAAQVDPGLVQRSALDADLRSTAEALRGLVPPAPEQVARAAERLRATGCDLVISDIAPLGLAAAASAGVPGVLVENFTWDWIFPRLRPAAPELTELAAAIGAAYARCDLRIQAMPFCRPAGGALQVGALARSPRLGRERTRGRLGIGAGERLVLVTMGGAAGRHAPLPPAIPPGIRCLVVGEVAGPLPPRVQVLAPGPGIGHPDLVAAADVVVGKLGYSTLAEAWQAGCGFVYPDRASFPEQAVLERHAAAVLQSHRLERAAFERHEWLPAAARLAEQGRRAQPYRDGRPAAAAAIVALLGGLRGNL